MVDPLRLHRGLRQCRLLEIADQAQAAAQIGRNEIDRSQQVPGATHVRHGSVEEHVFGRSAYGRKTPFVEARSKVARIGKLPTTTIRGRGKRAPIAGEMHTKRSRLAATHSSASHILVDPSPDRMSHQLGPGVSGVVLVHVVYDPGAGELQEHAQRDQMRIVQVERGQAQPECPYRGAKEPRELPPGGRTVCVLAIV